MNTPVIMHKATCPSCRRKIAIFSLPEPSESLYWPLKKESDHHVSAWQWKTLSHQHYNPYHYTIGYCEYCYYADRKDAFLPWDTPESPSIVPTKYSMHDVLLKDEDATHYMIDHIVYTEDISYESAVLLHFLAIHIKEHMLVDTDGAIVPQMLSELGTLYLRLAWLFREKEKDASMYIQIPDIFPILHQLEDCLDVCDNTLHALNNMLQNMATTPKTQNAYIASYDRMEDAKNSLYESIADIAEIYRTSQQDYSRTPYKTASLYSFLSPLVPLWKDICLHEQDAITHATIYFRKALENNLYTSHSTLCQTLELLADLYLRLQEKKKALDCLSAISKQCHTARKPYLDAIYNDPEEENPNTRQALKELDAYLQSIHYRITVLEKEIP